MLIKSRDPRPEDRTDRRRAAGAEAERDAAYLIDFDYKDHPGWAVIHDLRIEADGRTAQIDHLLISRCFEFYVLESKSFRSGFSVNDHGDFIRWGSGKPEGIPSPIEQNRRHISVLRDVVGPMMPARLGIKMVPDFRSLVLLSSRSSFKRPSKFDTSSIIKADTLRERIKRDIDGANVVADIGSMLRAVSSETLRDFAEKLAAMHTPTERATTKTVSVPLPAETPFALEVADHKCRHCSGTDLRIEFGHSYYFKCIGCGRNSAIPLPAGARLKKSGPIFTLVSKIGEVPFFSNPS